MLIFLPGGDGVGHGGNVGGVGNGGDGVGHGGNVGGVGHGGDGVGHGGNVGGVGQANVHCLCLQHFPLPLNRHSSFLLHPTEPQSIIDLIETVD